MSYTIVYNIIWCNLLKNVNRNDKENMALRGLKITWVGLCIAVLLISCSIFFFFLYPVPGKFLDVIFEYHRFAGT